MSLDQLGLRVALLWEPIVASPQDAHHYLYALAGAALLGALALVGWKLSRCTDAIFRIYVLLGCVAGVGLLAMSGRLAVAAFDYPYGLGQKNLVPVHEFPQKKLAQLFESETNIRELDFESNLSIRPWLVGEAVNVYEKEGEQHTGFSTARPFFYAAVTSVVERPFDAWQSLDGLVEVDSFVASNGYRVTIYTTRSPGRHLRLSGKNVSLAVAPAGQE